MKRTALLLLTTIYLLSVVGIGVNRFYCCGTLASVTITYAAPDDGVNKTSKNNHCCRHENKSFKINDSHVTANATFLSPSAPVILPASAFFTPINNLTKQAIRTVYQANAPPGNPDLPIYTLNCTYRI